MFRLLFSILLMCDSFLGIAQRDSVLKESRTILDKTSVDTSLIKQDKFSQLHEGEYIHFKSVLPSQSSVPNVPTTKPQIFNSGFIDFQNSGQMNASARVFKLFIGEPKKLMIPISVYSGVSGNNPNSTLASNRGSEQMVLGLINPMSGMFNISTENTFRFNRNSKSLTGLSIVYQFGEKMISGQQAFTFKTFNFFSTYANSGILFQTGAWEKDREKNMGIFWVLIRGHAMRISNSFEQISGYPPNKGFFKGYSIGLGIEINNVLNIKSYYYKYLNPGADIFEIPIYQLTFNYSLKPS